MNGREKGEGAERKQERECGQYNFFLPKTWGSTELTLELKKNESW